MAKIATKTDDHIINTMVKHMGGHRFMVMTGSTPKYKSIEYGHNTVTFGIKRNPSDWWVA